MYPQSFECLEGLLKMLRLTTVTETFTTQQPLQTTLAEKAREVTWVEVFLLSDSSKQQLCVSVFNKPHNALSASPGAVLDPHFILFGGNYLLLMQNAKDTLKFS